MVYLHGQQEMFIKVIMILMQEMVMDKCIGVMVVFIKDNGKMGYKMDKD